MANLGIVKESVKSLNESVGPSVRLRKVYRFKGKSGNAV
jgi:hypothetical protein